jgi:hypothetical protein
MRINGLRLGDVSTICDSSNRVRGHICKEKSGVPRYGFCTLLYRSLHRAGVVNSIMRFSLHKPWADAPAAGGDV